MADSKALSDLSPGDIAIALQDVQFAYATAPVLCDITLSFRPGELTCVIGPNGSGKSTLAGLMVGLHTPTGGRIEVMHAPLATMPHRQRARWISLVPQRSLCSFDFTVMELVAMGRYHATGATDGRRLPAADEAAIEEAMRLAGVSHLANRLITELSMGEQQRVGIARMLAQDTPVVILDEPTASLDLQHQLELMDLLEAIKKQGCCLVLITHDLNIAAQCADNVVALHQGRIAARGKPAEVLCDQVLGEVFGVRLQARGDTMGFVLNRKSAD